MSVARARQYRPPVNVDAVMLYGTRDLPPYFSDALPADYYRAGARFLWLVPDARITLSTQEGARQALQQALIASGYNGVTVNYGLSSWWDTITGADPVYPLEVSGAQNIDRASWNHIRDQVAQFADNAGFYWSMPIQFNVERAGSPFTVGGSGSGGLWGDKTPVDPRSLGSELPDIWGAIIAPALKTNWPALAIAGIAVVIILKKL